MRMSQKIIVLMLAAVMLLTLVGCVASAESGEVAQSGIGPVSFAGTPGTQPTDPARIIKSANEWNGSRTYAVVQVTEINGAEANLGTLAEGFPREGIGAAKLTCEAMAFINYDRLRAAAEAEDAQYQYFNIGQFAYVGGGSAARRSENRPDSFNGDITEEYLDALKASNTSFTYNIYLDLDHKDSVKVGDTLLISIDPQLSINPNSTGTAYETGDSKLFRAVVSPFAADHPQPHIAKFVDGKLVLPAELSGAFELSRLYDDTDPQLTGIKDGDSVEDVVAFLKAVEQDMARYEAERTPEPAVEPISSGTKPVDPEPDAPELDEPETSEPVARESNEGLQSAVGGTLGWYSAAYPDRVYYADHAGGAVVIDAGSNTQNVLEGAVIGADEILLRDAKGDCLLSMSFSMKEGFVINRMELDGSGKREIVRLPNHVLTYLNKDFIFTKGSKLYIQLKNTKVKSENDVYELMEIDVDAETSGKLLTLESGQSLCGGYGNSLFLRTDLGYLTITDKGESLTPDKSALFDANHVYRFEAFNIETGEISVLAELCLPVISYCSGRSVLLMTWEEDRFVSHIYDLATGEDKQTVVGVVPDAIRDRLNTCLKNSIAGEALDGTHFTFECPDFETSQAYCCMVDAENGVIILLDDVFADSEVKLPYGSAVFAETEDTFYFVPVMGGNQVDIYAVPRQQLLGGHVTDVVVLQ